MSGHNMALRVGALGVALLVACSGAPSAAAAESLANDEPAEVELPAADEDEAVAEKSEEERASAEAEAAEAMAEAEREHAHEVAVAEAEAVAEEAAPVDAGQEADSRPESGLDAMATSKRNISKASVATVANQAYTGKAVTPSPVVRWGTTKLVKGTHYTLTYANNVKAGVATITIRGKGTYSGTKTVTFKIVAPSVAYYVHRQTFGWEGAWARRDGSISGTVGQSKRLEGIRVKLAQKPVSGSILYQSHVQTFGWEGNWRRNGELSGTTGMSKRLEAIRIRLDGNMGKLYDVYYRVHVQRFGWMAWAKNGEDAGSAGFSYRLEAIQIKLVPKGAAGPSASTNNLAFVQSNGGSPKMGWQNPAGYPQVSPISVVLPSYCTGYHTYVTPSRISVNATREECVEAFMARAYEYLGTPYMEPWAREPGVGIDCSGLVLQCLYATGMDLEHARGTELVGGYNPYNHYWVPQQCSNSMRWFENNTFMPVPTSSIRRGDLLFFPGHIAIYLGGDQMMEAVSGRGVSIRQFDRNTLIGAQRPFV